MAMGGGGTAISAGASLNISGFVAGLQQMVSQTNASVASIQTRLQNLEQSGNRAFASLSAASKNASKGISADFSVLSDAEKKILSIQTAINGVYRAGSQLAQVGQSLGIIGAGIAAAGLAARKSAEDFDFWTRRVAAASAVASSWNGVSSAWAGQASTIDGQAKRLRYLGDSFEYLSTKTGVSGPEVAKNMYFLGSALGIALNSPDAVARVASHLETGLKAAQIAGIDVEVVVRGVSSVLGQFSLDADKYFSHIVAVVMNASQVTNVEFSEMIESFKMAGSAMHSMGMTAEEGATLLALLSDAGQKSGNAGRAVMQLSQGIIDPSIKATKELKRLFETAENGGRTWQEVLNPGGKPLSILDKTDPETGEKQLGLLSKMLEATKGQSVAQRQETVAKITTAAAARILNPLLNQEALRRENIIKVTAEQTAEQERLNDIGETTSDTLKSLNDQLSSLQAKDQSTMVKNFMDANLQIKLFGDQWEETSKSIGIVWASEMNKLQFGIMEFGKAAQAAIIPFLQTINNIIGGIRAWIRASDENTATFNTMVRVLMGIAAFTIVSGAILLVAGNLVMLSAILREIVGAFPQFIMMVSRAAAAIGFIPLSIMAVIGALVYLSQTSTAEWAVIVETWNAAVGDILGVVGLVVGGIVRAIQALTTGDWPALWNNLADVAITVVAYIALYIPKLLQAGFEAVLRLLDSWTGGTASKLVAWGSNLMAQLALGIIAGVQEFILPAVIFITQVMASLLKGFSPPKEGPLKDIRKWGRNLSKSLAEGLKDGSNEVDDASHHIAKVLSRKLEGHSPAKEGPLKDIDKWGQNLAKAYAKGWHKNENEADTAAEHIGIVMSRKLEGHSNAKDGPLSQIDNWAPGLVKAYAASMESAAEAELGKAVDHIANYLAEKFNHIDDAILPGVEKAAIPVGTGFLDSFFASFQSADFSSFDEISELVHKQLSNSLAKKLEGLGNTVADQTKKLDLTRLVFGENGRMDQAKAIFAGIIDSVRNGMADLSALSGISEILKLPEADDDTKTVIQDMQALVVAMSNLAAASNFVKGIEDGITKIQEFKDAIQETIDGIRDRIDAIRGEKAEHQAIIDKNNEQIYQIELQKEKIKERIDLQQEAIDKAKEAVQAERDVITGLQEAIDKDRERAAEAQDRIDALNDEKKKNQDIVDAIKTKYDLQRDTDKAHLEFLDLQADKLKVQNTEEENALQREITRLKISGGASPAQLAALQKQLDLTKDRHNIDEKDLDLKKQQADIANREKEATRKVNQESESKAAEDRIKAAELQVHNIQEEKNNIEKGIHLQEKVVNSHEKTVKNLEKAEKVEEKKLDGIQKEEKALDKRIDALQLENKHQQHEMELIERRAKAMEDGALKQQQNLLREADQEMKREQSRLKQAKAAEDAAKNDLDIQRKIIAEHEKLLQDRMQVIKAEDAKKDAERKKAEEDAKPTPSGMPGGETSLGSGSGADPKALTADIEARAEEFKKAIENMFQPFKDISQGLKDEKSRVQQAIEDFWTNLRETWERESKKSGPGAEKAAKDIQIGAAIIGLTIQNLYEDFIKGDFEAFGRHFSGAWMYLMAPVGEAIGKFFSWMGTQVHDLFIHQMTEHFGLAGYDVGQIILDILNIGQVSAGLLKDEFTTLLSPKFREALVEALKAGKLGEAISDTLKFALANVSKELGPAVAQLGADIKQFMVDAFGGDGLSTAESFGKIFSFLGLVFDSFMVVVEKVIPPLSALIGDFVSIAMFTLGEIITQVSGIMEEHGPEIQEAFEIIGDALRDFITAITPVMVVMWSFAGAILTAFVGGIVEGVFNVVEAIGKLIKGFRELWEGITQLDGGKILSGLGNIISGIGQGLWGIIEVGFLGPLGGIFGRVGSAITGYFGTIFHSAAPVAASGVGAIFSGIAKAITGAVGGILGAITSVGSKILSGITGIFGKISFGEVGSVLVEGLIKILNLLPDTVNLWVSKAIVKVMDGFGALKNIPNTILSFIQGFSWDEISVAIGGKLIGMIDNLAATGHVKMAIFIDELLRFFLVDLPAKLGPALSLAGQGIMNGISAWARGISALGNLFVNAIMGIGNMLLGPFSGIFSTIGERILYGLSYIWLGAVLGARRFVGEILAFIIMVKDGVIRYFQDLYDRLLGHSIVVDIFNGIVDWFSKLPDAVGEFLNALVQWVIDSWNYILTTISEVLAGLGTAIGDAFSAFGTMIHDALDAINENITDIWTGVSNFFEKILGDEGISGIISRAWDAISAFITLTINTIFDTITTVWTSIRDAIDGFLADKEGGIWFIIRTAWEAIKTLIDAALDDKTGIRAIITTAWTAVSTFISGILGNGEGGIQGIMSRAWTAISTAVKEAWEGTDGTGGVKGMILGAVGAIFNFITEKFAGPGSIVDILSSAAGRFSDALKPARDAMDSLRKTAENAWTAIRNIIGGGTGAVTTTDGAPHAHDLPGPGPDVADGNALADKIKNSGFGAIGGPPAAGYTKNWLEAGLSKLGQEYVWGGPGGRINLSEEAGGFDCSGFATWVQAHRGYKVNPQTAGGYPQTLPVPDGIRGAVPGDLVFYNMGNPDPAIQHVAVYIGNGRVMQSGGRGHNVNVDAWNALGNAEVRRPFVRLAMGGWINEEISGIGQTTGTHYTIGENGPELVLNQDQISALIASIIAGTSLGNPSTGAPLEPSNLGLTGEESALGHVHQWFDELIGTIRQQVRELIDSATQLFRHWGQGMKQWINEQEIIWSKWWEDTYVDEVQHGYDAVSKIIDDEHTLFKTFFEQTVPDTIKNASEKNNEAITKFINEILVKLTAWLAATDATWKQVWNDTIVGVTSASIQTASGKVTDFVTSLTTINTWVAAFRTAWPAFITEWLTSLTAFVASSIEQVTKLIEAFNKLTAAMNGARQATPTTGTPPAGTPPSGGSPPGGPATPGQGGPPPVGSGAATNPQTPGSISSGGGNIVVGGGTQASDGGIISVIGDAVAVIGENGDVFIVTGEPNDPEPEPEPSSPEPEASPSEGGEEGPGEGGGGNDDPEMHTGGWVKRFHNGIQLAGDEVRAILQQGELVLSKSQVNRLQNLYGSNFLPNLLVGTARTRSALSGIIDSSEFAAMGAVRGTTLNPSTTENNNVTLHVGTLVADERGLRELERKLQGVRIVENRRRS